MMYAVPQIVVDASVVTKWLIDEDGSDRADAIAERAAGREIELKVPDLCYAECANAIWRLVTKQQLLTTKQAQLAVAQLEALPVVFVHDRDLIGTAYTVAVDTGITVYDATYVALALALRTKVITSDRRMLNRLSDTEYADSVEML